MIRFLGDFHIDEHSSISLSKREIVILSYLLIIGRKAYFSELTDLFYLQSEIDVSYTKKIVNNLSKKLKDIVVISLSKDYVMAKSNVDVDVLLLVKEIETFSQILNSEKNKFINEKDKESGKKDFPSDKIDNSEIVGIVRRVIELYNGHFLPFIDNFWVIAYRNTLKNFLLKLLVKYYYSLQSFYDDLYLNIKIAKLLPELYINHQYSSAIYSTINDSSSKIFNVGLDIPYITNILFDNKSDIEVVRVKKANQKIINKLVDSAKQIDFLDDEEFILYIPRKNLNI